MSGRKLTKPQARMIARAMKALPGFVPRGADIRTAETLRWQKGYLDSIGRVFTVNRLGLEALLWDRKLDNCRSGSMATMVAVREVESAIAALRERAAHHG